LRKTEKWC